MQSKKGKPNADHALPVMNVQTKEVAYIHLQSHVPTPTTKQVVLMNVHLVLRDTSALGIL